MAPTTSDNNPAQSAVDPKATASPRQAPANPDDALDEEKPQIVTVTGVDLSDLPLTLDQIKEAVEQLVYQIRMEDLPEGQMPVDQEAMLQQIAAFASMAQMQQQHPPSNWS